MNGSEDIIRYLFHRLFSFRSEVSIANDFVPFF
jgi:hypothetical protein